MSCNGHQWGDQRAVLSIILKMTRPQSEGPVMRLVPLMQLRPLRKSLLSFTSVEYLRQVVWVLLQCHAKPYWNLSQKEKSVMLILSLSKKCIVFVMDFLALILFL